MARTPGPALRDLAPGVRLGGKVGEVWRHGNRAGVVWDWTFVGTARDFHLEAERYKFDPLMWGDESDKVVIVKLPVGPTSGECEGTLWTDVTVDGHSHRAVVVKGAKAKWQSQPAVPGRSNELRARSA